MPTSNNHEPAPALPMATLQGSRSKQSPSKRVVLIVASLLMIAILLFRSFSTSDTPIMLSSGLMLDTGNSQISSTRSLSALSSPSSSSSPGSSSSSTGKHGDVMSLYLNHASTGSSHYQLIPECLDPIKPKDFLEVGRKLG
eukprot:CAMPEP_0113653690 /NCGR_PEP_ID=MMETSP0017_2-20120614/28728_1 /TAXON_ID=2856 /ORGANISM="Cylindrotheca closterium" /LENGTH=140 /DNA_ID=CAMNT_0000566729 /DNA_START=272 /DNA_END=690 /DNA_ORIENTATION=- /assembly_acc=CAM_ASM_000147